MRNRLHSLNLAIRGQLLSCMQTQGKEVAVPSPYPQRPWSSLPVVRNYTCTKCGIVCIHLLTLMSALNSSAASLTRCCRTT